MAYLQQNYSFEFHPWPYNFRVPRANPAGLSGLGCACGGACDDCRRGLGLFDSWNPVDWGVPEWIVAGGGLLLLVNLFQGGRKVSRAATQYGKRRKAKRRSKITAEYRRQLKEAGL